MAMRTVLSGCAAAALSCAAAAQVEVSNVQRAEYSRLGLTVVGGTLQLPRPGRWDVVEHHPKSGVLDQVYLVLAQSEQKHLAGRRVRDIERKQKVERGSYPLRQLFQQCLQYAKEHDGRVPESFDDFDPEKFKRARSALERPPWGQEPEVKAPYYALVPGVTMELPTDPTPRARPTNRDLLAVELHPYAADGKHWVAFTNGDVRRVAVDPEMVARYGFGIAPVLTADEPEPAPAPATATYRVLALLRQPPVAPQTLVLTDRVEGETRTCLWPLTDAVVAGDGVVKEWASARARRWQADTGGMQSPIVQAWLDQCRELYGTADLTAHRRDRQRGATTSAFSVLGGRAAVRETLQMQALAAASATPDNAAEPIPISDIPGVQVKSHPFREMLGDREGGRLALADLAPYDHFFVYVAKPETLLPFLDSGAEFIFRAGSTAMGHGISYRLQDRYLARLGMHRKWLELVLRSGLISELAIVLPDLFLIDGTDMTVLVQIPQLQRFRPLLAMLGVTGLEEGKVVTKATEAERSVYWTSVGTALVVSTSREELDRVVATAATPDESSLGRSAEFQYMLTQLPVRAQTRFYAYFSDAFIRRLVGPATKIAQLRRLRARADLELLTAGALLHSVDGHAGPAEVETLRQLGYVPERLSSTEYALAADCTAASATYGTLAELRTLVERPVLTATKAEADAYKQYVESYSRFWRQFFDPIAVRLDDTAAGELELTTFILPLLDSSLYGRLRDVLAPAGEGSVLRTPQLQPRPVLQLSLNLSEDAWTDVIRKFSRGLQRYTRLDPLLFDQLGPSVHLAVQDADPIIALGSGDILGAFGGDMMRGRNEMMMLPVLLSVLTRPCSLFLELRDAETALGLLRRTTSHRPSRERDWEMQVAFYKLEGRDAWVYSLSLGRVLKLRFGLEVREGFLVISNLPWSQRLDVVGVTEAALHGAQLQVIPGAAAQQLPALFTAACDQQRQAAIAGIGHLYPFMVAGSATPEAAGARHEELLAFVPRHPQGGKWRWQQGALVSDVFGHPLAQKQPEYRAGARDFGLLYGVESLSLSMQLEGTGLRSSLRWRWQRGQ